MGGACSSEGEGRSLYRVLVGKPEGNNQREDPDVYGKITLRWIFKK
jgi:hypothetical protein